MDLRPPDQVLAILRRLWAAGHAGYVVGGSLRDELLGRRAADWDLATDALPEQTQALFPGAVYENAFGTVAVREGGQLVEVTTFRSDHEYADFRRPHHVEFGDSIELDLARRDFTVNAMAWGAPAGSGAEATPAFVDPHAGRADLEARTLRAVGNPRQRFDEDALRMVRAVRLAATLDFGIEAGTLAAIQARSELTRHLSGERLAVELTKLLAAPAPSVGLRLMAATGILETYSVDLAAQRGVPQNKIPGDDLWDHTVRTVDAADPSRPVVRLAALLHDIGKPRTMADGHFVGHDVVGAELAAELLERLRTPKSTAKDVVHLVRWHMFTYDPSWGDAGIRRFIKRVGREHLDALFDLREADNVGSGQPRDVYALDELKARVRAELDAQAALELRDLAISGDDLIAELGLAPGPTVGRILDALLERTLEDPAVNDRATLLLLAQGMLADE